MHHGIEDHEDILDSVDSESRLGGTEDAFPTAVKELPNCNTRAQKPCPTTSLVIAGGYCGGMEKRCEQFSSDSKTWKTTAWELSDYSCFHWLGVIGLHLYAIAGDSISRIDKVVSRLSEEAAQQLKTDSLVTTGWELESTLPQDCSDMRFCVMDDCIYCCGEISSTMYGVWQYNPSNGNWVIVSEFTSEPRAFFHLISFESKLLLLGGMNTSNYQAVSSFEAYHPNSDTWENKPDMAVGRYNFGAAILEQHLFVVGGYGKDEVMLASVEAYCFKTEAWSLVRPLPVPRASMACQSWDGMLYCLGGETSADTSTPVGDVLALDPKHDKWSLVTQLSYPRLYPTAILLS